MNDLELKPEERERRSEPRSTVDWPCKVYLPQSGRYVAGQTCNLSRSGALLRLERSVNLAVGETIYLGIACKRRQALIRRADMQPVTIQRVINTTDDRPAVAVRFDLPGAAAMRTAA